MLSKRPESLKYMEPLEINKYPDKILRTRCLPVEKVTEEEKELLDKMYFTMKHFCGIGLSDSQIGVSKKLIVAEVENMTIKLANPEIVDAGGSDKMAEGCLSVPGVTVHIKRATEVTVKGLNEKGETVEIITKGLL